MSETHESVPQKDPPQPTPQTPSPVVAEPDIAAAQHIAGYVPGGQPHFDLDSTDPLDSAGNLAHVDRALSLVDVGLRGVRNVTNDLRPALLDDLGLLPALRSLVFDFGDRHGVPVSFDAPDALPYLLEPFSPQDPTYLLCPTGAGTVVYRRPGEPAENLFSASGPAESAEASGARVRDAFAESSFLYWWPGGASAAALLEPLRATASLPKP